MIEVPKRRVRRSSEDAQRESPWRMARVPSCAKCGAHDHVTEAHSKVTRRKGLRDKPGRKTAALVMSNKLHKKLARMLNRMEIMCKLIRSMGITPIKRRRRLL